jgi:streptogramin lyase
MNQTQTVKNNTPSRRYARRWFGRGYTMEPDSLFRRLAGSLSGILPWLALLPLAALSQANYATPYTFTTIAGKVGIIGSADGTGSAARFSYPISVAVDTNGNVYVADCGNSTIRKMTPLGTRWVVTTMAGKAGVTGSADGTGSAARFNEPYRVAVDSAGNLYVADFNNCTIRKVVPVGTNWVVTTLAGRAETPGAADGTGSAARFYGPTSVAVDSAGNVYVADVYNNAIRKVTPVGTNWVVTTLAGKAGASGSADGTGSAARFNNPFGVAVDSAGSVYVSDQQNCAIRKMTPLGTNWVVTTLAGRAGITGSADGTNSTARFGFNNATGAGLGGLAVDGGGNVYVADFVNNAIRKVTPVGTNWVVTTLAGSGGVAGSADGTGTAAQFNGPNDVAVDTAGNPYVADFNNCTIRRGFAASSVPAPILQPPSLSAGQFGFGITGLPGLAVNIEASTDLSQWQVLSPYITLVGGTNYYVNPSPSQSAQFYRAKVR